MISRVLSSAAAVAIAALGCASDVPVTPPSSRNTFPSTPEPRSCEYVNFAILDPPTENQRQANSMAEITVRRVEAVFSKELESAGFHRVTDDETPWLFFRALLRTSERASNVMVGAVHLAPLPNLHRDYWAAVSEGSIPEGKIGMTLAVEIGSPSHGRKPDSVEIGTTSHDRKPDSTYLERQARDRARRAWDRIAPLLLELCNWRQELSEDGLSIEDIRRELVDEMNRIRHEHRRAEQKKKLKLEVEP